MTDRDRFHTMLFAAGRDGVHSHTARTSGGGGNPSQRARELVKRGVDVRKRTEHRGGRNGIRFWLGPDAPPDAEPVNPDEGLDAPGGGSAHDGIPPVAVAPSADLVEFRDYTDPGADWVTIPLAEAGWRRRAA